MNKPLDPAFPTRIVDPDKLDTVVPGMSRRDFFAAHALQGLLANPIQIDVAYAVMYTDALLAELDKEQDGEDLATRITNKVMALLSDDEPDHVDAVKRAVLEELGR